MVHVEYLSCILTDAAATYLRHRPIKKHNVENVLVKNKYSIIQVKSFFVLLSAYIWE